MKQQLTMGQFALTRQLLMGEHKQPQLTQQHPQQQPHEPTKVTKVRRARQSRNPQVSVARRNERERNRVKMVNNGFARLRDHLPIEYLQQNGNAGGGYESAGSETPDMALGAKSPSSQSSKAKKFSKVETLRAAIKHINMLVELIRSAEPDFQSVGIHEQLDQQQQQQQQKQESHQQQLQYQPEDGASSSLLGYDDIDGPVSCGDGPLSCGSSSSLLTSSSLVPTTTTPHIQASHQQHIYSQTMVASQQQEQFVKLEPTFVSATTANETALNKDNHIQFQTHHHHHHHHHHQQQQHTGQPASPFDSARTTILTIPLNQHGLDHYSQAPTMMTQVHQHQTIAGSETTASEHTQLWIQQHQSSFIEQQQQQHDQLHQRDELQLIHHGESQSSRSQHASTPSSSAISPNPMQQQHQPKGYLHDNDGRGGQIISQPIYYSQQDQLHFQQQQQQQQSVHQGQHFLNNQARQQQLNFNDLHHVRTNESAYSDLRQQTSNTLELNRNHYGNSTVHRSAFVAL